MQGARVQTAYRDERPCFLQKMFNSDCSERTRVIRKNWAEAETRRSGKESDAETWERLNYKAEGKWFLHPPTSLSYSPGPETREPHLYYPVRDFWSKARNIQARRNRGALFHHFLHLLEELGII